MSVLRHRLFPTLATLALLGLSGCTSDDEGAEMKSTEAAQRLTAEVTELGAQLSDATPEVKQDEFLTCEPEKYDGQVYPTYTAHLPVVRDAITVIENEIVPAREAAGWTLRKRDSEDYVSYDFDKDGFIVGVSVYPDDGLVVGGSGPCVEDDQ